MPYADKEKQREAVRLHYLKNKARYLERKEALRKADPDMRKLEWARRRGRILGDKSARVLRALTRLSRDRWLHPNEVHTVGMSLARCLVGVEAPAFSILERAVYTGFPDGEITEVGMLRGQPPLLKKSWHYERLKEHVRNNKNPKPPKMELIILRLNLKEMTLGC